MRGSAMGYSGSMGNSTRVTQKRLLRQRQRLTSDTLSSAGHPASPPTARRSTTTSIYSNNLDVFTRRPAVRAAGAAAGGRRDRLGRDEQRQRARQLDLRQLAQRDDAVLDPRCPRRGRPRATSTRGSTARVSRPAAPPISTSCDNQFFGNNMGQAPPGFKSPDGDRPVRRNETDTRRRSGAGNGHPNGIDFWWDELTGNTGNCWFDNTGPDGTARPSVGPARGSRSRPAGRLACCPRELRAPASAGRLSRKAVGCWSASDGGTGEDTGPLDCDWWQHPPQPASAAAKRPEDAQQSESALARSAEGEASRPGCATVPVSGLRAAAVAASPCWRSRWRCRRRAGLRRRRRPRRARRRRCGRHRGTEPVGEERGGSVAQLVECRDWNDATAPRSWRRSRTSASQIDPRAPESKTPAAQRRGGDRRLRGRLQARLRAGLSPLHNLRARRRVQAPPRVRSRRGASEAGAQPAASKRLATSSQLTTFQNASR